MGNSLGQNIGMGSLSLLQGIFAAQGSEPRSPALQVDSLPAEPQGKPKKSLEALICVVKCWQGMRETTSNYEGGFPGGTVVKNPPANAGDIRDTASNPGVKKIPWRRKWQPTPVFLPGKSRYREPGGLQSMESQKGQTPLSN